MKWFKCEDRLPKLYERVLIFVNIRNKKAADFGFKDITEGRLDDYREVGEPEWLSYDEWFSFYEVTHWMRLPKPPID